MTQNDIQWFIFLYFLKYTASHTAIESEFNIYAFLF